MNMPTRHDYSIILAMRGANLLQLGVISLLHLVSSGKYCRVSKFRPVIDNHTGEAQMTQQRHQFPRHMTGTKDEHSAIIIILLGIIFHAIQLVIALMFLEWEHILHCNHSLTHGNEQPPRITAVELIQYIFCENFGLLASRQIAIL